MSSCGRWHGQNPGLGRVFLAESQFWSVSAWTRPGRPPVPSGLALSAAS